jgi:hypothetical protein
MYSYILEDPWRFRWNAVVAFEADSQRLSVSGGNAGFIDPND